MILSSPVFAFAQIALFSWGLAMLDGIWNICSRTQDLLMILARECYRIKEYDTNGKPVVVTEALLPLENKNTRSVPNKFTSGTQIRFLMSGPGYPACCMPNQSNCKPRGRTGVRHMRYTHTQTPQKVASNPIHRSLVTGPQTRARTAHVSHTSRHPRWRSSWR
jgi:hypothetical protein